jgi:arylformamidase
MHPSAAQWCVERGITTVGWDYLTMDPLEETGCPTHRILLGQNGVLIENLILRDVQAGSYELIAAPIPLHGVDGAWCRALLRAE